MYARLGGVAILVVVLLSSVSARADDEFDRKGFYAGAGGIVAFQNFGTKPDNNVGGGFDLQLGYRLTEVISVETEFEWAGFWDTTNQPPSGVPPQPVPDTRSNVYTWSLNLKANVPLGRISPYAGLGFGFHRVRYQRDEFAVPGSSDDINAMMKVMLGVDFYVTEHIVLTPAASYNVLFNGNDGRDYIGLGARATYRF